MNILGTDTIGSFSRVFGKKLYKQYLTALSKCKTPEELLLKLNSILKTEHKIDPKALNFAENSTIDMDKAIESFNKITENKSKIIAPANATPQEKMGLILDEIVKQAKKNLNNTISTNYKGQEKEILTGDYANIIQTINTRLEFLK